MLALNERQLPRNLQPPPRSNPMFKTESEQAMQNTVIVVIAIALIVLVAALIIGLMLNGNNHSVVEVTRVVTQLVTPVPADNASTPKFRAKAPLATPVPLMLNPRDSRPRSESKLMAGRLTS